MDLRYKFKVPVKGEHELYKPNLMVVGFYTLDPLNVSNCDQCKERVSVTHFISHEHSELHVTPSIINRP
jgi:hypothetical protein